LRRDYKKLLKRRSAIEPVIAHMKHDHRLNRNFLKGHLGDQLNAILAGCAYNFKKLLSYFRALFSLFFRFILSSDFFSTNLSLVAA